MTQKPEALRMADALEAMANNEDMGRKPNPKCKKRKAAAELRRQHEEIEALAELVRADERARIAEQLAQQEPVVWKNAAIRVGEELSSVGPDGYYDMTAEQWLDWAMDQRPYGKNFLPAQRTWVGLTDEERNECTQTPFTADQHRAIEAKLKEKNNG